MAITKAIGVSATEHSKYVPGPVSSVQRLEQALKSGNAHGAKLALESVKQNLPIGQGSVKDLAAAVTALDRALGSGDISKATEVLKGVKEQAKKLELNTEEQRRAEVDSQKAAAASGPGLGNGVLDIKA